MHSGHGSCSKISNRFLNRYKPLIGAFAKCPISIQDSLLKHANLDLIKLICEISLNVLHGTVPLAENCLKKLKKYKRLLFFFSDKNKSLKFKIHFLKKTKKSYRKFIALLFKCVLEYI